MCIPVQEVIQMLILTMRSKKDSVVKSGQVGWFLRLAVPLAKALLTN